MFYVGLDIHSKRISFCVLNETGQVVRRSQVRTIDQMMRILEDLPERFEVCYEASCGYSHFHDLLRPASQQLRRDLLLEEVETLNRQLRRIEQELNRRAQQTPALSQLRSIPGVGVRTLGLRLEQKERRFVIAGINPAIANADTEWLISWQLLAITGSDKSTFDLVEMSYVEALEMIMWRTNALGSDTEEMLELFNPKTLERRSQQWIRYVNKF